MSNSITSAADVGGKNEQTHQSIDIWPSIQLSHFMSIHVNARSSCANRPRFARFPELSKILDNMKQIGNGAHTATRMLGLE